MKKFQNLKLNCHIRLIKMVNLYSKLSFIAVVNEPVCIIAPSGKGKSTLLEVISGLGYQIQGMLYIIKIRQLTIPLI